MLYPYPSHVLSAFGVSSAAHGVAILLGLFYIYLAPKLAIGYVAMTIAFFTALDSLSHAGHNVAYTSAVVFAVAWVFQFIGHKVEGKSPSFFKDLLFLSIGPLWTMSKWYKRVGIDPL